jgi:hypothetical protein
MQVKAKVEVQERPKVVGQSLSTLSLTLNLDLGFSLPHSLRLRGGQARQYTCRQT